MGATPPTTTDPADVEMTEAVPQEQSGPLPVDVDAEVAETQKT
jgi:hypothetical protein